MSDTTDDSALDEIDRPPKWIADSPLYRQAERLRDDFMPNPDYDYDWMFNYAQGQFAGVASATAAIDEKADRVFRYLGIAAGVIGIGFATLQSTANIVAQVTLMIGIFTAILAALYAFLVRRPVRQHFPTSVEDMFGLVNHYECEDYAKGYAALVTNVAIQGRALVNQRKAAYLKWAYVLAFIAIVILVFLLPMAMFWGAKIISSC